MKYFKEILEVVRKSQIKQRTVPNMGRKNTLSKMKPGREPGKIGKLLHKIDRATSPKSATRELDKDTKITFKNAKKDMDHARDADQYAYTSGENPNKRDRTDRYERLRNRRADAALNGRRKLPEERST